MLDARPVVGRRVVRQARRRSTPATAKAIAGTSGIAVAAMPRTAGETTTSIAAARACGASRPSLSARGGGTYCRHNKKDDLNRVRCPFGSP